MKSSGVPKWMLPEPAVCFPNRSEEASQNKTEEEGEEEIKIRCKRPRTTLDGEGGVEEFLVLLERIEEMKKHELKKKRVSFSGSSISGGEGINAVEEDQMLTAMTGMQQAQGSSAAVDMIAHHKSSTSIWKPCFQWEDFNKSNSLSAEADSSGAAAGTEKSYKDGEGSTQIGNGLSKTTSFWNHGDAPAESSHDRVDDVNMTNKEDVDGSPPELELQLFPM